MVQNIASIIGYIAGEIGDFLVDEYRDISYLSSFKFVPQRQQTVEMLQKVMEYHRQHVYVLSWHFKTLFLKNESIETLIAEMFQLKAALINILLNAKGSSLQY